MQQIIDYLTNGVTVFGVMLDANDTLTITASLILLLASRPISRWLNDNDGLGARASMMRLLNYLIIFAVVANAYVFHTNTMVSGITRALIVLYFAVLIAQVINYFIRRRFGKKRMVKNRIAISDTYSSRGLSLIVTVVVAIITIIICLKQLGLDSLLEAGGALGIMGLVLAMTQASWAPDIISGLIILNSRFCEDGDIIQFKMDGKEVIASIFKTKLFHTECLDLANNHRVMVRNAKLRDYGLQNLSRFASARGLREVLLFNIDYKHSEHEVSEMFKRSFAEIDKVEGTREEQHEPEIRVHATGNYAVTWAVYYYIKDVKKLLSIRQLFRAYVLEEASRSNISLATPILQTAAVDISRS